MRDFFIQLMIPDFALPFISSSVGIYGLSCLWILFGIANIFTSNKDDDTGPWKYSIALGYVMTLVITNVLGDNYDLWVYWLVPGIYMFGVMQPYIGRLNKV